MRYLLDGLVDKAAGGIAGHLARVGDALDPGGVDDALAAALLRAAAVRDPARAAALLARPPRIPLLRAWLRRLVAPGAVARQLPLL